MTIVFSHHINQRPVIRTHESAPVSTLVWQTRPFVFLLNRFSFTILLRIFSRSNLMAPSTIYSTCKQIWWQSNLTNLFSFCALVMQACLLVLQVHFWTWIQCTEPVKVNETAKNPLFGSTQKDGRSGSVAKSFWMSTVFARAPGAFLYKFTSYRVNIIFGLTIFGRCYLVLLGVRCWNYKVVPFGAFASFHLF